MVRQLIIAGAAAFALACASGARADDQQAYNNWLEWQQRRYQSRVGPNASWMEHQLEQERQYYRQLTRPTPRDPAAFYRRQWHSAYRQPVTVYYNWYYFGPGAWPYRDE
jgi:hypothetical protein